MARLTAGNEPKQRPSKSDPQNVLFSLLILSHFFSKFFFSNSTDLENYCIPITSIILLFMHYSDVSLFHAHNFKSFVYIVTIRN